MAEAVIQDTAREEIVRLESTRTDRHQRDDVHACVGALWGASQQPSILMLAGFKGEGAEVGGKELSPNRPWRERDVALHTGSCMSVIVRLNGGPMKP